MGTTALITRMIPMMSRPSPKRPDWLDSYKLVPPLKPMESIRYKLMNFKTDSGIVRFDFSRTATKPSMKKRTPGLSSVVSMSITLLCAVIGLKRQ